MPNHKSIRAFMTQFLLRCARRQTEISLAAAGALTTMPAMLSHVVVFWTNPAQPGAADELIAGANRFLKSIPGVLQFHVGKMVPSERPAVEKSYQVALNLIFPDKRAEQAYQTHPQHLEFVEKHVRRLVKKAAIYDFE
jgi:metal-dependent amidase/aminoacylase/carboxypeptidase family protein